MKKINKCEICGNDINEYNYYVDEDEVKYFCSINCVKKVIYDESYEKIINKQICKGYDYCEKLNNIESRCIFEKEITVNDFHYKYSEILSSKPHWCIPAQISIIIGNMKLYEFVKQSEEESKKLNEESLKLNEESLKLNGDSKKTNEDINHLTKIMVGVSFANLILIVVQIIFTIK